nr:biliverdin-producing heme oxygenase [Pedobacter sp. ASV2]
MIASLLRTETAEKHKQLESLMFVNEIMNNSLSINGYKKLLTINYIIHQELEPKLIQQLNQEIASKLEMDKRVKLPALEKDLQYWKIDTNTRPDLNFEMFVPGNSTAEILGALYVLEGATLGGNVIKKHILANTNFVNDAAGLSYYGVYGEELGAKWKTFVSILNESVVEADYDKCVNSANATFDNLINLSKQLAEEATIGE